MKKIAKKYFKFIFIILILLPVYNATCPNPKVDLLKAKKDWCFDHNQLEINDIDLIVRTINVKAGWDHYPQRLEGIAEMFYIDWPYNKMIGLIGIQEASKTKCCKDSKIKGTECLQKYINDIYGKQSSSYQKEHKGIIVDSDWEVLKYNFHYLGKDSITNRQRCVAEAIIKHKTKSWKLRFYNLHLSHKKQRKQRIEQIEELILWVTPRIKQGELPPIIVGDFNFNYYPEAPNHPKNCYKKMCNAGFRLLFHCNGNAQSGYNQIWIGKKYKFPQTTGRYVVLRSHSTNGRQGVDTQSNDEILSLPKICNEDFFHGGPLSDHKSSPAVSLKILGDDERWKFEMMPPPVCP